VRIRIKPISALRDYLGETVELEFEKPVSISELVRILREEYGIPDQLEIIAIVGDRVVSGEYIINHDEVVYLTPPFAGGSPYIDVRLVKEERVDLNKLLDELSRLDREVGALVLFIGLVKGRVEGVDVEELVYEAVEEAALSQIRRIALEEAERHGLIGVVLWHWVGVRRPSEPTIIIATLARSRSEAFEASRTILERVKKEVPVFKLERRNNGEYWVIGEGTRHPRRRR
jgi:molybdopterin synthase catalytic subunit